MRARDRPRRLPDGRRAPPRRSGRRRPSARTAAATARLRLRDALAIAAHQGGKIADARGHDRLDALAQPPRQHRRMTAGADRHDHLAAIDDRRKDEGGQVGAVDHVHRDAGVARARGNFFVALRRRSRSRPRSRRQNSRSADRGNRPRACPGRRRPARSRRRHRYGRDTSARLHARRATAATWRSRARRSRPAPRGRWSHRGRPEESALPNVLRTSYVFETKFYSKGSNTAIKRIRYLIVAIGTNDLFYFRLGSRARCVLLSLRSPGHAPIGPAGRRHPRAPVDHDLRRSRGLVLMPYQS